MAVYADSIEFYHDGNGLQTSKSNLLAIVKENICGKVIRVLVPGNNFIFSRRVNYSLKQGIHQV